MSRKFFNVLMVVVLMAGFLVATPAAAQQPVDAPGMDNGSSEQILPISARPNYVKPWDQPNPTDFLRNMNRMKALKAGNKTQANQLALEGSDKVLVLLVEFAGTDTFTWTYNVSSALSSHWDPLGIANPAESGAELGDCSKIVTGTHTYTYSGPMHNALPRPISVTHAASNKTIWTEDFSPKWYDDFMFKEGVVISYTRQDGSPVHEDFTGKSVTKYYENLSNGKYTMNGDVVGWLKLPHSTWYYDADECPGAQSWTGDGSVQRGGMIPGAGTPRDMVKDATKAVNAKIAAGELPADFWTKYDVNPKDGVVDRLWIVHAGYGEEDDSALLNATNYGEAAAWSHSSGGTKFEVDPTNKISVGPYIMMPENGGIAVFAHEYGHNLGAMDLYSYGNGETSAGFYTLMSDSWIGTPLGFQPEAMDPMHLDWWGWLNPYEISDPSKVYTVTLGQPTDFPNENGMSRAAKIELPDGVAPQQVPVWDGGYYWWGGKGDVLNSRMVLKNPIHIPAAPATATVSLNFDLVYDTEEEWDFMWVQTSVDGGANWKTITNTNMTCLHDPSWIGGEYGFPEDLCGAGLAGFTGYNSSWPYPESEEFDLSAYRGKDVLVRLWYMTDWGTSYTGTFVDNIEVNFDGTPLLADDAETDSGKWTFEENWVRNNGLLTFAQRFYLQWRNTNANGGYDDALGGERWRFGPVNSGLVAWYENEMYTDNEIANYMLDWPSYGPKGRMLVVDSHPEPYRDSVRAATYPNSRSNLHSRSQMRNAPFGLEWTLPFTMTKQFVTDPTEVFGDEEPVTVFHDSINYFPGAEYSKTSSASASNYWFAKQWDASVTMPSVREYGVKGGYNGGTFLTRYSSGWYGYGDMPYYSSMGTGPGAVSGQYGWHAQVIGESGDNTWATVRVWNDMHGFDAYFYNTDGDGQANLGDVTQYYLDMQNVGNTMEDFLVCVPLDTTKVEYLWAPDAYLVESCPTSTVKFDSMKQATPGKVGALVWQYTGSVPFEEWMNYLTFKVKAVGVGQWVPTVKTISISEIMNAVVVNAPWTIGKQVFLPIGTK